MICPECGIEFEPEEDGQITCRKEVYTIGSVKGMCKCLKRMRNREYERLGKRVGKRNEYNRQLRKRWKDEGRCARCGSELDENDMIRMCDECVQKIINHRGFL